MPQATERWPSNVAIKAKRFGLRTAASVARLRRDQGKRTDSRDILAPVHRRFRRVSPNPKMPKRCLTVELA
jgi:hypothetical protein